MAQLRSMGRAACAGCLLHGHYSRREAVRPHGRPPCIPPPPFALQALEQQKASMELACAKAAEEGERAAAERWQGRVSTLRKQASSAAPQAPAARSLRWLSFAEALVMLLVSCSFSVGWAPAGSRCSSTQPVTAGTAPEPDAMPWPLPAAQRDSAAAAGHHRGRGCCPG